MAAAAGSGAQVAGRGLPLPLARVICKVVPFILVLAFSLGLTAILIIVTGHDPLAVYIGLIRGGFGTINNVGLAMNQAAPLLLCALGLVIAFRCGVWNIGAEGQLYMGAFGAAVAGLYIKGVPAPWHLIIIAIAAFVFGAVWGVVPAILKVKFKTNEIITSLLMVFIATNFAIYLVLFPMKNSNPWLMHGSNTLPESGILPALPLPGITSSTQGHVGIIIALALAAIVWFVLEKTTFGYRIRTIGTSPAAAQFGGIPVSKMIIASMILSGGLAGLAGFSQVSGTHHQMSDMLSPGYGFLAILVVFVGRLNVIGAVLVAIVLGGLMSGSYSVQSATGVDVTVVNVLIAILMLGLVIEPYIERRMERALL